MAYPEVLGRRSFVLAEQRASLGLLCFTNLVKNGRLREPFAPLRLAM